MQSHFYQQRALKKGAVFFKRDNLPMHRPSLKLELSVIPAQAGIQFPRLVSRLRGNDEPENRSLTMH